MLYVQCNKDWFISSELGKHLIGIKKSNQSKSWWDDRNFRMTIWKAFSIKKEFQTLLFLNTTILLFLKAHWE